MWMLACSPGLLERARPALDAVRPKPSRDVGSSPTPARGSRYRHRGHASPSSTSPRKWKRGSPPRRALSRELRPRPGPLPGRRKRCWSRATSRRALRSGPRPALPFARRRTARRWHDPVLYRDLEQVVGEEPDRRGDGLRPHRVQGRRARSSKPGEQGEHPHGGTLMRNGGRAPRDFAGLLRQNGLRISPARWRMPPRRRC